MHKGFTVIAYNGNWRWDDHTVYALDFGDCFLMWKRVAPARTAQGRKVAHGEATRLASERLCNAITQYTRLPLRDVTLVAQQIEERRGGLTRGQKHSPRALAVLEGVHNHYSALLLPYAPPEDKRKRTADRLGCIVYLVFLAITVLFAAIGFGAQHF